MAWLKNRKADSFHDIAFNIDFDFTEFIIIKINLIIKMIK